MRALFLSSFCTGKVMVETSVRLGTNYYGVLALVVRFLVVAMNDPNGCLPLATSV